MYLGCGVRVVEKTEKPKVESKRRESWGGVLGNARSHLNVWGREEAPGPLDSSEVTGCGLEICGWAIQGGFREVVEKSKGSWSLRNP